MFLMYVAIGLVTGTLGAMVGIGGGTLLVPVLTLFLGVPVKHAIGISIVSVIATSTTGAVSYVREGLTNVRVGLTLELATTVGAIAGGITAALLAPSVLSAIFAVALFVTAAAMTRQTKPRVAEAAADRAGTVRKQVTKDEPPDADDEPADALADRWDDAFYDEYEEREVDYRVRRLPLGMALSFLAGNVSGLLGIGGGTIKVPAMTLVMNMPMKAAVATSNFMIGVTAVASAYIYYSHGYVDPALTVPTVLGVFGGSYLGARWAQQVDGARLRQVLAVTMLILSVQMAADLIGWM